MINQKFKIVFQISQPANIPQKWFSAQNGPLDVRFQIRLNPNRVGFSILEKSSKNHGTILYIVFKRSHHTFCQISPEIE